MKRWNARWIWSQEQEESIQNSFKLFRKVFVIPDDASRQGIRLHITADTRYVVYLNGSKIGHGPPLCVGYYHYYDSYDVASVLQNNHNCIAVVVNHLGTSPGSRGGLLAEIVDGSGKLVCGTDGSWSVAAAASWRSETYRFRMSYYASFQEWYDARAEPVGWMETEYDDGVWQAAQVLRGQRSDRPPAVTPWSVLIPRDIPHMIECDRFPERIDRLEEVIDLTNRIRAEDLTIHLSMSGEPLNHASITHAHALLGEHGETLVRNSLGHLDGQLDGIYNPCIVLDFGRSINAYPELILP